VYEERDGRIRTYHYDFTGSTVALADDSGAVAVRVSYGPWGEIAARTGSTDTPFLYGGLFGVITGANGLVHMRYRWYSPQIKRFLSKDSEFGRLGTGSDSNRYAFAGSNPINFNDPSGRFLNALIGAVGGAIVNVAATTIVSFVTTGKPPTAGELAGAALEGALGGALLATCGPGCAVAASALIGGFSAAAGSVTAQLIDDGRVDPAQLGVDTGFGLAFGGLGGKVKIGGKGGRLFAKRGRGAVGTPQFGRQSLKPKAVSRRASNNLLQPPPVPAHITRPRSSVPKPALTFRLRVALGPPKAAAGRLLADVGSASAETLVQEWSEPFLLPSEEAGSATAGTRMSARASGRARVVAGLASTFGEFAHWDVYMMALSLAGRPEPDPAPALAVF
jgi:RHS repeat-associated protein